VHELAITQGVVDTVTERTGDARVATVRLRVGRLTGVVPDALRFCFDVVVAGTPLEGASLEIEETRGRGHCRSCDHRFAVEDPIILCDCGSADVDVRGGQDLVVAAVVMA
jgi:hydrogenase nickel incorporation protein HypA/HybF